MSQEYTPVNWVDETTSQQGTLINADRLDQMQTAHHYADGFEEVDAIPTEDPGVDYHKVVYCTADATFYRWDGEVWTADIDEETKHLLDQEIARAEHAEGLIQGYLDAHEANHNNPHQVTKAQVGLGNCDNTADLDKPISTAAQAALDTKADKATTLAGYGITDAYTKAQADTLLADKADKADVYDKTAADTLLAGKVDKLVSSPAGTYKSVTVNAQGQVTAGTNPDTLAGYGITDAYNKTEADNLLAAKADTTALTDGSVTKVGTADLGTDTKPIKLVAGVPTAVTNDLVSTSGAQTIGGAKTFTGQLIATGQRAYAAANTTDVATIGTLDGYAPMVRTTGNMVISGNKIFTSPIIGFTILGYAESSGSRTAGTYQMMIKIPKSEITIAPIRSHVIFGVTLRGNAAGFDMIDIAFNNRNATGIKMAWAGGMAHTSTYILSMDDDYIYVSRININNSNDGVASSIITSMGVAFSGTFGTISAEERESATLAGTEIGRVNSQ